MKAFERRITAAPEDIDELGHVNNAIWVRWIQDIATAHWYDTSLPEHRNAYIWVVIRHEIDYLRAVGPGETVTGRTWISEPPKGARCDRHMEFVGADGKRGSGPKRPGRSSKRRMAARSGCRPS